MKYVNKILFLAMDFYIEWLLEQEYSTMIAQFLFAFYRVRATMMWKRKPNGHFATAVMLFYP